MTSPLPPEDRAPWDPWADLPPEPRPVPAGVEPDTAADELLPGAPDTGSAIIALMTYTLDNPSTDELTRYAVDLLGDLSPAELIVVAAGTATLSGLMQAEIRQTGDASIEAQRHFLRQAALGYAMTEAGL